MVDIIQMIIQFLNINCSVVSCYYANPLEGLFYLLFFPTIFIILFVYIISNSVLRGAGLPQGLRLLIGIAVYIFIILQGWFTHAVWLSKLWFILLPLLGVIWFVMRHFGEGKRAFPAIEGGLFKYAVHRAKEMGGQTGMEKLIDDRIKSMRAILHEIEHPRPGTDIGLLFGKYWAVKNEAEAAIRKLEAMVGWPASKTVTSKYWEQISEITEKLEKIERKAEKEAKA